MMGGLCGDFPFGFINVFFIERHASHDDLSWKESSKTDQRPGVCVNKLIRFAFG